MQWTEIKIDNNGNETTLNIIKHSSNHPPPISSNIISFHSLLHTLSTLLRRRKGCHYFGQNKTAVEPYEAAAKRTNETSLGGKYHEDVCTRPARSLARSSGREQRGEGRAAPNWVFSPSYLTSEACERGSAWPRRRRSELSKSGR